MICVYFGIVWFMNFYCFYLNCNQLPQPRKPTALLDGINLIQTMSGVVLTVTTLHYWKQAVWDHGPCEANEPHIRMMAFAWSGGHVLVAILSFLNDQYAKSQQTKPPRRRSSKTVKFAPNPPKTKAKKIRQPLSKGDPAPELIQEESTSSVDETTSKKKKLRNRNKSIPKNIEIESSESSVVEKAKDTSEASEEPSQEDDKGAAATASKKKKKKKKKNNNQKAKVD